MTAPLRLADLLAALSMMSDLGFGLPAEEAMRRAIIATRLARRMDLGRDQLSDVYYTALLQHIGCTGFAHETAVAYGDELAANAAIARTDANGLRAALGFVAAATAGRPPADRLEAAVFTILQGGRFGRRFATATCEVGRETARHLGLGERVGRALEDVVESWDGKQGARGLRRDEISVVARVSAVAAAAASAVGVAGAASASGVVRRQAGGLIDPDIAAVFADHEWEILDDVEHGDAFELVLDAEPHPVRVIDPERLVVVAVAIGRVADLKSTFTLGHSSGVAALAVAGGKHLGLDAQALSRLEVAALLHDVGRVGISNAIWERRGSLTQVGWEQVRLHAYHSERILGRSEALRAVAPLAGMHHERLDGSGYHRGIPGSSIPREARLLAAADALDAMTHDRPHRPALPAEDAIERLAAASRSGELGADAVEAVIAGSTLLPGTRIRTRSERAAGLSEREVEVLRLVARGLSNREIADQLVVSTRTAEHHVQHIYTKIGFSSRAAAALFAMEHGLLD